MKANFSFLLIFLTIKLHCLPVYSQSPFNSDLPIIKIETHGGTIVDEPKIEADLSIINNGRGERNIITDDPQYTGKIAIEIRGSSSQDIFPKKQYGFELRDEFGADMDTSLLEMPPEEDWILFAPYNDKSLMRDVLAYKLGRDMGRYAVRTRYCEAFINDEYMGVFVLMEKIKRDDQRVDIANLNPDENSGEDVTGGYIIKIDKSTGNGGDGWLSQFPPQPRNGSQQIFFMYEYPKDSEITSAQKEYIQGYISDFEDALSGPLFRDPFRGYHSFIDVGSFIDFMLINELTKNVDGYRLSTFIHKKKITNGGKLHMGPIWDFNLGFGNADYCTNGNPEGFVWDFNKLCPGDWWLIPFWWDRLRRDHEFNNEVRLRWDELRGGAFQTEVILDYIDSVAAVLGNEAAPRNFEKWPVLGQYVWPNYYVGDTYQQEIDWLKNWVSERLAWMDENLPRYVSVLGVEEEDRLNLSFYPNPFIDQLTFEIQLEKPTSITVQFVNSLGEKLDYQIQHLEKGLHKLQLVPELPKGIYFAIVQVDTQTVEVVKLIKN